MTRTRSTTSVATTSRIAGVLIAALIGVGTLFAAANAHAQSAPLWADRAEVGEKLAREFGETSTGMGLAGNGGMVELFASPGGETWTLLLTMPNGLSRIIIVGEGWTTLAPLNVSGRDS